MEEKRKYLYLEMMRILACFFVIFNHTTSKGFFLFSRMPWGGARFWCYLWISIFCKFAVPLFFMISGALLLPRETESIGALYKKRVLKMVCALLAFSALYYGREIQLGNQTLDVGKFFLRLYEGSWNYTYWYLYTYIAFLITLPILRVLAKNLKDRDYLYLLALNIIFVSVIPVLQYLFGQDRHVLNPKLNVEWITSSIVLYPLMGYFLQYRIKDLEKRGKTILLLWVVNILTICLSCYMTYLKIVHTGKCSEGASQSFHNTFVVINAMTIFLTVKYLFLRYGKRIPVVLERLIASAGSATFGIYLLHILILKKWRTFQKIWDLLQGRLHLNQMLSAFLVCACVMTIGYVITVIMKKIPIIRRIL